MMLQTPAHRGRSQRPAAWLNLPHTPAPKYGPRVATIPRSLRSGQAASLREANRLALGVVAALGKKVEAELRLKLDHRSIGLSWGEIRSTDIQTRTRSVKQLVDSGLKLADAMNVAGLTMPIGE